MRYFPRRDRGHPTSPPFLDEGGTPSASLAGQDNDTVQHTTHTRVGQIRTKERPTQPTRGPKLGLPNARHGERSQRFAPLAIPGARNAVLLLLRGTAHCAFVPLHPLALLLLLMSVTLLSLTLSHAHTQVLI